MELSSLDSKSVKIHWIAALSVDLLVEGAMSVVSVPNKVGLNLVYDMVPPLLLSQFFFFRL